MRSSKKHEVVSNNNDMALRFMVHFGRLFVALGRSKPNVVAVAADVIQVCRPVSETERISSPSPRRPVQGVVASLTLSQCTCGKKSNGGGGSRQKVCTCRRSRLQASLAGMCEKATRDEPTSRTRETAQSLRTSALTGFCLPRHS